jgi:hypothetical protein
MVIGKLSWIPSDAHKTAFHVDGLGGLEWIMAANGALSRCWDFFQRVMELVLRDLIPRNCFGLFRRHHGHCRNTASHYTKLTLFSVRVRKAKLKIHPAKTNFGATRIRFLAHIFYEYGIAVDE